MNDVFVIALSEEQYLQTLMNKVSRSFALVTPAAGPPLSHYLSTAYLICRVVDNIEDSHQPFSWQQDRFSEFDELLRYPDQAQMILAHWDKESWPGLTNYERQLMGSADGTLLWKIYGQLPEQPRKSIEHWSRIMSGGMRKVMDPQEGPYFSTWHSVHLPAKESDYNQYCYYVAGTVGHLSTEIVIDHYKLDGAVADRLLINAEACGRALQKTNIVKDFAEDIQRDVCYLPEEWMKEADYSPLRLEGAPTDWKRMVIGNVLQELQDSVTYVLDLPYTGLGYRQASLLCLFPAYQTMLKAAQNHDRLFTGDHAIKISSDTFKKCLEDAQILAGDNEGIWTYGQTINEQVELALNSQG